MVLALTATAIVIAALLGEMVLPRAEERLARWKAGRRRIPATAEFDPGRDRRAESRARLLLKSCVNDEEWEMYRDLGFIRVWSIGAGRPVAPLGVAGTTEAQGRDQYRGLDGGDGEDGDVEIAEGTDGDATGEWGEGDPLWDELAGLEESPPQRRRRERRWRTGAGPGASASDDTPYAYLIYPHKPILAYVPQTGRLLSEHCVEFPDTTRPYGSARLPDSDDVLAKWMALTGDEQRLLASSNMHLPGRQCDPRQVKRDLWRLRQWERSRGRAAPEPRDSRVPSP